MDPASLHNTRAKTVRLLIASLVVTLMTASASATEYMTSRATASELWQMVRESAIYAIIQKPQRTGFVSHKVKQSETISQIAEEYDLDVETIMNANHISNARLLQPGHVLVVPPQKGIVHEVQQGQSFWDVGVAYGVDVTAIMKANHKTEIDILHPGEKLIIPQESVQPAMAVSRARHIATFRWPTVGELSSPYGMRWGRMHTGIDIANDEGTPIIAARRGKVTHAGWISGYGYTVIIDHGGGIETLYGHNSGFAVKKGQAVNAGQIIAYMGNTGNSTGSHLHFGVYINGDAVDPSIYLQ